MKIAYCLPSIHIPGGIERTVLLKANYYADVFGYEVYIITTDGKDQKAFYHVSPKVQQIHLDINFDELYSVSFIKRVWRYFWKQRIHKKLLKKTLFEIKPDFAISLMFRELRIITSIKDGSRKIGELQGSTASYRNPDMTENRSFVRKILHAYMSRQFEHHVRKLDWFVMLTHQDSRNWPDMADRITVIPNPLAFFPDRASDCLSRQVISVGRYCQQKGHDMLFEAWKLVSEKHPDWTLRIYGGGEKRDYQPLVDSLGLAHTCILESAVPNIDEKFRESSIHVLSSRFEGFGMVIIEAMACGLPVVSFDCECGPNEIIKNDEDGFLVEVGNVQGLAEKISFLIENEEIRIRMGQQARMNVERFKLEQVAQQWRNVFESICPAKGV